MRLHHTYWFVSSVFAVLLLFSSSGAAQQPFNDFLVGAGIADVTGPIVQVGFMGYCMMDQIGAGIHTRLRARAFIFAEPADPNNRVVFVSVDICMTFQQVWQGVIAQLQQAYCDLYTEQNVMVSSIHTHSGPGGFSHYLLYDLETLGFVEQNYDAVVSGIVAAVKEAHENLQSGRVLYQQGQIEESNINRSPFAYLFDPISERNEYTFDTDHETLVLRIQDKNGNDVAMIDWFAVHCTSMNNTNTLVSGDNKGYASYLFEQYMNGNDSLPGAGPFVAAFAQANEGDVSPNTAGPHCLDSGLPCDFATSTCHGESELCVAFGPGSTDFQSTEIIGRNQFEAARSLWSNATATLTGRVAAKQIWLYMQNISVSANFSGTQKTEFTCMGALGDSFAAGTIDGPGINLPWAWAAHTLPLQMFQIGDLFIVGVPGEFSTMSGRRLRATIAKAITAAGGPQNPIVQIAGLANSYSHYITTAEEYLAQRYEGASTMYGPFTLAAYQQWFYSLAVALVTNTSIHSDPAPPSLPNPPSFLPPVVWDAPPSGHHFGDVLVDAQHSIGQTASVSFVGANPRNNLRTEQTYLSVDRLVNGTWSVYRVDGDWETKLLWRSSGGIVGEESTVTVLWDIPAGTPSGTYRITYYGDARDLLQKVTPFTGSSSSFTVH